ncbi:alpha/beta fold hydrolase [Cellulomonas aerilata]|uniref:Alpha/beta hydrolase n=1 Tax=Cellulomonas aerilata TaxID=515326 RepID=A0A512DEZ3_9CELL|nr:alpha/beta fold hydrolase [Cellulomonas aerilata]GEO35054.1 alpha/beta hydrolase [Cellulomonas aerilata]
MDTFTRDGLTFDVRDHGPVDGPAVVCLHGFPQDGSAFDDVARLLAAQGLRVLVPDQRGYSPRARPQGRAAYTLREVVDDVVALLDAAGVQRAHVVGHDWGGAVAWTFASRRADRTLSVTAVSTPHPAAMTRSIPRSSQPLRSAYMAGFQLPWLPERLLTANGGARLRQALLSTGLDEDRVEHYVRRLLGPGAMTAALNWYRAIPFGRDLTAGIVHVPAGFVYGRRDRFFSPTAVRATGRYVRGPLRIVALDTGHWLPEQRSDRVAEVVLGRVRTTARAT